MVLFYIFITCLLFLSCRHFTEEKNRVFAELYLAFLQWHKYQYFHLLFTIDSDEFLSTALQPVFVVLLTMAKQKHQTKSDIMYGRILPLCIKRFSFHNTWNALKIIFFFIRFFALFQSFSHMRRSSSTLSKILKINTFRVNKWYAHTSEWWRWQNPDAVDHAMEWCYWIFNKCINVRFVFGWPILKIQLVTCPNPYINKIFFN